MQPTSELPSLSCLYRSTLLCLSLSKRSHASSQPFRFISVPECHLVFNRFRLLGCHDSYRFELDCLLAAWFSFTQRIRFVNPFTTPSCKVTGLKTARTQLQTIFSGPITSTFNATRFDDNPFTCQCPKKKTERLNGLQFYTFIGRFQVISWQ